MAQQLGPSPRCRVPASPPSTGAAAPASARARRQSRRMRCAAATVEFSKYQGLGNDFILRLKDLCYIQVDNRHQDEPVLTAEQAKRVCDRNFGVGGDGVIFALPPAKTGEHDYTMRIFNSDGSEPEMCGNGIRCLAKFVADRDGDGAAQHRVHTLAGLMQPQLLEDGQVCVDMGPPILQAAAVPTTLPATQGEAAVQAPLEVDGRTWLVTAVSMGNPHAITFGTADGQPISVDAVSRELEHLGPQFETHPAFPTRTNTEFIEVLGRGHVRMLVWERGAGRTLACGTGACAVVVAGVLEGRLDRRCRVDLPGGPLQIEWREADGRVYMTGPAELSFTGTLHL